MLDHSIHLLKQIELFGLFKKISAMKVFEFYFFFFLVGKMNIFLFPSHPTHREIKGSMG